MEKGLTYGLFAVLFTTEILFLIFSILALKNIFNAKINLDLDQKKLKPLTSLFLIFAIISEISYGFFSFLIIGKIIYISFLIYELYFINFLQKTYLINKTGKLIFSILLISLVPFFVSLIIYNWNISLLNGTLAIESFIVGCICLNFFSNLKNNITADQLINEKGTLLMLGLFFCYSIPLPFNSTVAIISIFDKTITNVSNKNFLIFFSLSRLGTICYIFFFYFIRKAFNERYK